MGWRHFHVANRKNQDKWVFAELVAACDPNVRFWLNAKVLKNRRLWAAGWQTLGEIKELATDYNAPPTPSVDAPTPVTPPTNSPPPAVRADTATRSSPS